LLLPCFSSSDLVIEFIFLLFMYVNETNNDKRFICKINRERRPVNDRYAHVTLFLSLFVCVFIDGMDTFVVTLAIYLSTTSSARQLSHVEW
jgi:hypothetical protein